MNTAVPRRRVLSSPPPPETISSSEEATPEAEQRLIEFCEAQINKMSKFSSVQLADGEIGFDKMNQALANYQNINLSLIALYNLAKVEHTKVKDAFDEWFAEKYVQIRSDRNPTTVSSTKWLSTKEIEMEVRVTFKKEFNRLHTEVAFAEQKVAFLRRLLDSWSSHQYVLSQISKNIISEMQGSNFD